MTDADPLEAMRAVAREVLREVVHSASMPGADPTPQVPPPPVAAVLRPSTWTGPAIPGEVIGDGGSGEAEPPVMGDTPTEAVTIETDEDLERFVRALLARLESPRERRAIRAGQVRFTLRRATGVTGVTGVTGGTAATGAPARPAAPAALRIAAGAVTERTVRDAAHRGARLVLARGAVLTPLARDQARALGVQIEKEGRC
ncbi:MAG TPA: hypothetical protein VG294_12695 [Solirubrobacteraceae bacterium]|jgi:hypothetical protein|nr:hypothetical protein [Solirubrobacteraceae bacterium]